MTVVSSSNETTATTTEMSFGTQSVFPDVQPNLTAGKKKNEILFLIFIIIIIILFLN